MTLRRVHGNAARSGKPLVVEVLPADEQPRGLPAPASAPSPPEPAGSRRPTGQLVPGPRARELARRGGLARAAKARQLRVLEGLGLRGAQPKVLRPFLEDAEQFAKYETERLARTVGGGVCEGAPASFVQSAALETAGSRAAFAKGDMVLGSRLAAAARQNLLAAHELCAREAQARAATDDGSHGFMLDDEAGR